MDSKILARYEAQAEIIKALAHPTRLYLVDELSHGEKCVHDLADKVGMDMSTISKHLSILKGAGIVADDKRGLNVFYRIRATCILKCFGCVGELMEINLKEQMDLLR